MEMIINGRPRDLFQVSKSSPFAGLISCGLQTILWILILNTNTVFPLADSNSSLLEPQNLSCYSHKGYSTGMFVLLFSIERC